MIWKDRYNFLDKLANVERFGVFLDLGVGKTSLLLALIDQKFFEDVKRVLIITPKKVSIATWQKEIDKWDNFKYMKHIVQLIAGTEKERNTILKKERFFGVDIISSSLLELLTGKYIETTNSKGKKIKKFIPNELKPNYDMIIVDECSQFKDVSTRRFKALLRLMSKYIFLLSGTPFPNIEKKLKSDKKPELGYEYINAEELYYSFYLLGLYKSSFYDFKKEFCYSSLWEPYKFKMSVNTYNTLTNFLHNYCITKQLDLDVRKFEIKRYVEVDEQRMKTLKKEFYLMLGDKEEITAENKGIMINKALQLANGFVYDENQIARRINENKFKELQNILKIVKGNVAIFYNFKEDKNYILTHLKGVVEYKGLEEENAWNEGKIKYLLLSPFSEKFGLNLQMGGNEIIWYSLVWSAESFKQSNARIYRTGQEKDVYIYYIIAKNSFDDYVYDKLVAKIDTNDNFINYLKEGMK